MEKKTISSFIAALRKANGLTQQEVADRLNISNKAVSRWERDECAPDITLIPALAEMLGVTCDELLKGERIFEMHQADKSEPKVEKQVKAVIRRTVSAFKQRIWFSLALSAAGLACMYGISYGFYRPVIGFFVMLMLIIASGTLNVVAMGKMREAKRDNELFDGASPELLAEYHAVLAKYSFACFSLSIGAVLLSLPFVIWTGDFVNSVLSSNSYVGIALVEVMFFLWVIHICKPYYFDRITDHAMPVTHRRSPEIRRMNFIQLGCVALACLMMFGVYSLRFSPDYYLLSDIFGVIALLLLLADIVCMIVFSVKYKEQHKQVLITGIRNVLLAAVPIFLSIPAIAKLLIVMYAALVLLAFRVIMKFSERS